ncbi:hypothetical protein [Microscilla marina]|uniref:Uncharacterized protein n=1 Tax=Microscilla marina ATCC 23134 TaxID=313606 RepID=A1ZUP9_MICM2|nr:hypothetical protein [Microscilla marina]EAY25935.1 hypothetical protein M23134_00889 [Microscilla marina ATCC 23134]
MRSRFKLLGDAGAMPLLFIGSLVVIVGIFIENPTPESMGGVPQEFYMMVMLVANVVVSFQMLKNLNIIFISDDSISFRHFLLRTHVKYSFSDLDGFNACLAKPRDGVFDILYLKKDGKVVKQVSSKYYSNFPEIRAFLSHKLNYLKQE